jgi:hypothetical protein
VDGLKRFIEIAPSQYHGLNFCQGTVSEMLKDPRSEQRPCYPATTPSFQGSRFPNCVVGGAGPGVLDFRALWSNIGNYQRPWVPSIPQGLP